jgi:hypothetical protein
MSPRGLLALALLAISAAPLQAHPGTNTPRRSPTAGASAKPQEHGALSDVEEDRVREAQDPGERIKVYLAIEQDRLGKFETGRASASDPKLDYESYFNALLTQYIQVNDETKDWISDQYERGGDMRAGLKALLEQGPKQLELLRAAQQNPDKYYASYSHSLQDAIDDLTDTLDGASKAMNAQIKQYGELKREQKLEAQETKERVKEEKKREKEEKKLRKREHKKGIPGAEDDNPN